MNYTKRYYIAHPLELIRECVDNARWFIQRGKRGYADCDVWSLDYYLSGWLPKALREHKNNSQSYPKGLTQKKWQAMLEKMAKGFDECDVNSLEKWQKAEIKKQEYRKLFAEWYWDLWD